MWDWPMNFSCSKGIKPVLNHFFSDINPIFKLYFSWHDKGETAPLKRDKGKEFFPCMKILLPRGVRPRLEGKPKTPLSSRVATRVSWSPLSGLKGAKTRGFHTQLDEGPETP